MVKVIYIHYSYRCINCGKPAKFYAGYLRIGEEMRVLAGWCSKTCRESREGEEEEDGSYGEYQRKFGIIISEECEQATD